MDKWPHAAMLRPMSEKQSRGPHAQRRAATRAKIMEAAVRCLAEFGYAATSTPLVARLGHVSRGSLLHQFPTKVDLILAVAEHAAKAQGLAIRGLLADQPPGRERFLHVIDATWTALQEPESVALLEIMIATRNDPELAQRYPDFAQQLEAGLEFGRRRMATELGLPESEEMRLFARLSLAALRGLAVETLFAAGPAEDTGKVVQMLKTLRTRFADELLDAKSPEDIL